MGKGRGGVGEGGGEGEEGGAPTQNRLPEGQKCVRGASGDLEIVIFPFFETGPRVAVLI